MAKSAELSDNTASRISLVFFLNLGFTLVELAGGIWMNSLAIVSDALHDAGDSLILGLSWYFEKVARRKGDMRYTYGYRRYSLLGAVLNTFVMISGALLIIYHAVPRLTHPGVPYVNGMIVLAPLGVLMNGYAFLKIRGGRNFQHQILSLHLLEDVFGWLLVLVLAVILKFTDYYFLDPLLSMIISGYILYNVLRNLSKTLAVFLQSAPDTINNAEIIAQLSCLPKVQSVHDTHIWSLDGERHVLTTHVIVNEDTSKNEILNIKAGIKALANQFRCEHITVEIEYNGEDCTMEKGNPTPLIE